MSARGRGDQCAGGSGVLPAVPALPPLPRHDARAGARARPTGSGAHQEGNGRGMMDALIDLKQFWKRWITGMIFIC